MAVNRRCELHDLSLASCELLTVGQSVWYALLELRKGVPVDLLLSELESRRVIGFSETGTILQLSKIFDTISHDSLKEETLAIIVGGFPSGEFSDVTASTLSELYSLYPEPLEAWTVTARVLGAMETQLGII